MSILFLPLYGCAIGFIWGLAIEISKGLRKGHESHKDKEVRGYVADIKQITAACILKRATGRALQIGVPSASIQNITALSAGLLGSAMEKRSVLQQIASIRAGLFFASINDVDLDFLLESAAGAMNGNRETEKIKAEGIA